MRLKLRSLWLVALMTLAISSLIPISGTATPLENENGVRLISESNTYEKTKYYRENPFGIIGGFHLVGFGSVETKAHTNGNILTRSLKYVSNFGTNGLEEVSYIEDLAYPVDGFKSTSNNKSVLVVGGG